MKKWILVRAEGFKAIFAAPEVVDLVRARMIRSQVQIADLNEECDVAWVDNPGMCLVDRAMWSAVIDDLRVEIPASDFHDFMRQLRDSVNKPEFNSENDPNRGYRSIYGWINCIALTQEQYEKLLAAMIIDADSVKAIADDEDARFARAIKLANEKLKQDGVGVEVRSMKADLLNDPKPLNPDGKWN